MDNRVLVVGGTRGTGLLIAHLLLRRDYAVRALARDPAEAASRLGAAVDVVAGDITKPHTLQPAVRGVIHIVFTAGVRSGRFAREDVVRTTDYEGVLNTLKAAQSEVMPGRFLYLNSIGMEAPSLAARLLNAYKRNTLVWRRRAEAEIRASDLDYTIIRVGFLRNQPGGRRAVEVSQGTLPLTPGRQIARADVAEVFVEALEHPRASRATFEVVWGKGRRQADWSTLLDGLAPDS